MPGEKKDRYNLTEGAIASRLILFALPFLLSNVIQHLYNAFDQLLVEFAVNSHAYNGVYQSGKVSNVLVTFFTGISAGAGVVVSQYFGAKDKENLKKSVHTAMAVAAISGLILTGLGLLLSKPILQAIGTHKEDMEYALSYLRVYFCGVSFLIIYNVGAGILRAVGDTVTPMLFLIFSCLLNTGLDLFIIPKYGVVGAAWTTVLGQVVSALLVFLRLYLAKRDYRFRFRDLKIDLKMLKKIIKVGLPAGMQSSIISVAHLFMTGFYNTFTSAEITGTYHYLILDGFIYLPFTSFSTALSTFVGQNVGAGKYDRAKKAVRRCLVIGLGLTVFIGVIVMIFSRNIMGMLGEQPKNMLEAITWSSSEAMQTYELMLATSIKFMFVMVCSYPILVITDTLAGALRGAGLAFIPAVIYISSMCVFRIAFLFVVMHFFNDILVVYLCFPSSWILSSTAMAIYYFKSKWDKKSVMDKPPPLDPPLEPPFEEVKQLSEGTAA